MAATVLISATGCPSKSGNPTILPNRNQNYVVDIPVPAKFELNERKSTHTYTAGKRLIKHVYEGKSSPLSVKSFYAQSMPAAGWEMTDEKLAANTYTLKFRKGDERCDIRVERVPSGLGQMTQITASVRPEYMEKPAPSADE